MVSAAFKYVPQSAAADSGAEGAGGCPGLGAGAADAQGSAGDDGEEEQGHGEGEVQAGYFQFCNFVIFSCKNYKFLRSPF